MTSKQTMMVKDLLYAESDLNNPTFTWAENSFPCIPSAIVQRLVLGEGGYEMVNTVSMTVRIFNADGSFVFPDNVIPSIKDDLFYGPTQFRIEQVNPNVLGACFEIVGNAPYAGV